jgi:hypothetical protein
MVHGLIFQLLLSYNLFSFQADATILGGYQVGPVYATVSVETVADEKVFAYSYAPILVTYDYRIGVEWNGFDIGLSRWCQHRVGYGELNERGSLSGYISWSNQK